MPYEPHKIPGSTKFKWETKTQHPGAKVWVDGGVITYPNSTCLTKLLDCSATCCLQHHCAATKSLCINYIRRPFTEVYIGFFVITMIVVGIPTCILTVEFCLNAKFCGTWNEDLEFYEDSWTICEGLTRCFTCGKSHFKSVTIQDEYIIKY